MAKINSLDPKYLTMGINPQHALPTFDEDGNINMLVEIPMGSFNKYEYVTETNLIKLDRVLYEMMPYPLEYGLIPQTWDEDDDLLDIVTLISYPTFPGCLISVRPIGVMKMNDSGEKDDKIFAVPVDDARFKGVKSLADMTAIRKDEIEYFFTHYKDLQFKHKGQLDKKITIDWEDGADKAMEIIKECQKVYAEKFGTIINK